MLPECACTAGPSTSPTPTLAAAEFQSYLAMGMDGMFANYPDLAVAARNTWAAQPTP